jgi:hypothetical protein
MSTVMEMQTLIKFIREILDRIFQHGGLIVPHRTLRVEAQTGLHTMEVLINDIPYPPPFIHLFHLSHPDIVKVTPEPEHTPPRIIVIGKPHAINMAMTGRFLLSVQSSVMEMMRLQLGTLMPDTQRSNALQILGLTRQLDIIMEQNHRLQSPILALTPPTTLDGPYAYRRLVTPIKCSSTGNPHTDSTVMWSTLPTEIPHTLQHVQEQPLIIPNDLVSPDEDSDSDGANVTSFKRKHPASPAPRSDDV